MAMADELEIGGLGDAGVAAVQRLRARGGPKINVQIVRGNAVVVALDARRGYAVEPRISMGRSRAALC
jgi:hypothetical protein